MSDVKLPPIGEAVAVPAPAKVEEATAPPVILPEAKDAVDAPPAAEDAVDAPAAKDAVAAPKKVHFEDPKPAEKKKPVVVRTKEERNESFKFIMGYAKRECCSIIIGLIFLVGGSLSDLAIPYFIG